MARGPTGMAAGSRANSFGTFLNMTNGSQVAAKPVPAVEFDLETSTKMALQSVRTSVNNLKDLQNRLKLTTEQTQQVLSYLTTSGMLDRPREDEVALTSLTRSALDVFTVV